MPKNSDNTNAFLIHISAFASRIFPFGGIVLPLILWTTQKNKSEFIDSHGKEAVNFNITYTLYKMLLSLTLLPTLIHFLKNLMYGFRNNNFDNITYPFDFWDMQSFGTVGFISLLSVFSIIKGVLIVIAAIKANNGEMYNYPLTIKFIK